MFFLLLKTTLRTFTFPETQVSNAHSTGINESGNDTHYKCVIIPYRNLATRCLRKLCLSLSSLSK